MAVMAGHQVQVYDHIKGHQYRQQYIDRIQVNAKGQGQDRAAKARHGLGGIGYQHNNRQPDQITIHNRHDEHSDYILSRRASNAQGSVI